MKKYFLHNGTESSGPFNFEELIAKKITKKTPVWFEGMENWKYAGEIDERRLQSEILKENNIEPSAKIDRVFSQNSPRFTTIVKVLIIVLKSEFEHFKTA